MLPLATLQFTIDEERKYEFKNCFVCSFEQLKYQETIVISGVHLHSS
jgi:hypothetical protein